MLYTIELVFQNANYSTHYYTALHPVTATTTLLLHTATAVYQLHITVHTNTCHKNKIEIVVEICPNRHKLMTTHQLFG